MDDQKEIIKALNDIGTCLESLVSRLEHLTKIVGNGMAESCETSFSIKRWF